MLTPIILLLGLAVATCVIAYVSDNLGKKLGKKRVSLWGLRPRQTATLLTMASGLGIMLITLFVLLGLWGPLRHALLSYDRVRANSRELSRQNSALQANLSRLGVQSRKLEEQVERSQERADAAQQQFNVAAGQLKGAQRNLKTAQGAREAALRAERTARSGERAARQRAEQAQLRLVTARQRLATFQQRLTQVQTTLQKARTTLDATRKRLVSARAQLNSTRTQLASAQREKGTAQGAVKSTLLFVKNLTQEVAQQEAEVERLQQGARQQQATVSQLEAKRVELEQEATRLTSDIANLAGAAQQYYAAAQQLATGQVIIPVAQVFAERRLPPRPSATLVSAALNDLLAEGKKAVSGFGAQDMVLAPVSIEAGTRSTELDQEQILRLLVNHLATFDVPVSVRLLAARNHFAGEKEIMGRMETIPVSTAFARGEMVAAATIDGRQEDYLIFNQLLTLVNEGEKAARKRKVTPPLTPDNPHFYATGTNQRIFEALRRIQALKGPASVRLVAADNISTVEPMNVRLEVASQAAES